MWWIRLLPWLTFALSVSVYAENYEIPYMPRGSDLEHQGFMRVTNLSTLSATVEVFGVGDNGASSFAAQFSLAAGESRGYRITELESGAPGKGLSGSIGTGVGDWQIIFTSSSPLRVVGFYRNPTTGFLNSLHDTAHSGIAGVLHRLGMVNPGSNPNQIGKIRLINGENSLTTAFISAIDDQGITFPSTGTVEVDIAPFGAITLSMAEMELGSGNPAVRGALGDGSGKWRMTIAANNPIGVMSLIFAPNGYLSNVTSTGNYTASEGGRYSITCETLDGASVMGSTTRNEYLGFIGSASGADSIFNTNGDFGSSTSPTSIFNPFSRWGDSTSGSSAFNPNSTAAPLIVKHGRIISFLSTNPTVPALMVHPDSLSVCSFTSLTARELFNPRDFNKEPSEIY